jgi:hypothetical protein
VDLLYLDSGPVDVFFVTIELIHKFISPKRCPHVAVYKRPFTLELIQLTVDSLLFIKPGSIESDERDLYATQQFHILNSSEVTSQFSLGHRDHSSYSHDSLSHFTQFIFECVGASLAIVR